MSEGKRKASLWAKLLGTIGWGLILAVIAYFWLPASWLGIQKPPLATFFLFGLAWPVVWLLFWVARVLLPMPFELVPRLFELILVGPGHLLAWIAFGKRELEAPPEQAGAAPPPGATPPPAPPAPSEGDAPPAAAPPS